MVVQFRFHKVPPFFKGTGDEFGKCVVTELLLQLLPCFFF